MYYKIHYKLKIKYKKKKLAIFWYIPHYCEGRTEICGWSYDPCTLNSMFTPWYSIITHGSWISYLKYEDTREKVLYMKT